MKQLETKDKIIIAGTVNEKSYAYFAQQYWHILQGGQKEIVFFFTSGGGCCSICASILFLLRDLKKRGIRITMVGAGVLASAGLIIFMEGDERYCLPETWLMAHQPWVVPPDGINLKQAQDLVKTLDRKSLVSDYIKKIKLTKEQTKVYADGGDVVFTMSQALKNGILTGRLS